MKTAQTSGDQVRHRLQTVLVGVLERTRLMQGQPGRQLLVEQLRDRLGQFPLREHAELRLQTAELVRACRKLTDGLQILVETVEHLEPGTEEVVQLRRLRDEWEAAEVLTPDDWTRLRPLLETLTPTNLTVLYQRATEHRSPGPPSWCSNAWQAFVHLAGQNAGPDGLPPSMAFLALLEDQVDAQGKRSIRLRNDRLATDQKLTAELAHRRAHLERGGEQPMDTTSYLVVQIEPHLDPGGGDDMYALSHFRQWYGADSWHSRRGEPLLVRLSDLEREVERLIEQMEIDWAARTGTVVVEFVLPWELLNVGVDRWRKETGSSRPIALAMDYPVVVRSLERLRTQRWHRAWNQRWRQLLTAPAQSVVYWSHPSGKDYFTRLEAELKADDRVVSLVLSEPPAQMGATGQLEIEAALRAGLPVIIWHRGDCTSAEFREAVTGLVTDGGIGQLPQRAKELRHQALRLEPDLRDGHIGHRLTILWDDPVRRPDTLGAPDRGTGETW
ncbi:effector-associated domain 2-containing protein [Actinoplanes sp. CA-252034]|uniref:VMAP-C domain-containing protein n=1 Tax=Actinoplanes sp. CA-252034 TaxID=3239906 RepID=UPI003D952F75